MDFEDLLVGVSLHKTVLTLPAARHRRQQTKVLMHRYTPIDRRPSAVRELSGQVLV
jgi:hypothetical protein